MHKAGHVEWCNMGDAGHPAGVGRAQWKQGNSGKQPGLSAHRTPPHAQPLRILSHACTPAIATAGLASFDLGALGMPMSHGATNVAHEVRTWQRESTRCGEHGHSYSCNRGHEGWTFQCGQIRQP